ncbi:MAG: dCTP deaminase [Synergistetes bacterium]|nr:dCTP deaminase [Synergistota bacterium]MDK2870807.1 dCTP deaminase [bacterium]
MSVIPSQEIIKAIDNGEIKIIPLLDSSVQIGKGSLDVRLGLDFILFRKRVMGAFDPLSGEAPFLPMIGERIFLEPGQALVLHPGDFALSSTLEYVALGEKYMAYVEGRSSWGRLGLIVATATVVSPGYRGVITLELANLGVAPLYLYPGTRIAQLVFHEVKGGEIKDYSKTPSKYIGSLLPEVGFLWKDPEWEILKRMKEEKRGS